MGTVYRNVYSTTAVTSAPDSAVDFLRAKRLPRLGRKGLVAKTHGYEFEAADGFRGDAEDGFHNKRAWVLQERAMP